MNDKILIIDDDPVLIELIQYNLEEEGYQVSTARNGQEGIRLFFTNRPDVVILDLMMPKLNGYEVCKRIREMADTPIIMLTAKGREEDIIQGLDLGADDYLTKPFRVRILLARVRAVLRRARAEPAVITGPTYSDDYLSIDLEMRRVMINDQVVKLTPTEYKLLALLVKNKGRVLEFRTMLEQVWGFEYIDEIDYLRVYVWHLRRKLEPDPKNPIYLINELNTGYRFEPQK